MAATDQVFACDRVMGALRRRDVACLRGRPAAVLAVARSFCAEAAVYYATPADGEVTDAEARRIAGAVDRFFTDIEEAGRELARK